MKTIKVPESAVLNAVIEVLNYMKVPYGRVNNTGAIFSRNGQTHFGRRKHQQKGVADIVCCWNGQAVAIECKSSTGKLSEEQVYWLHEWQKAGGHFMVARDAVAVRDFLVSL